MSNFRIPEPPPSADDTSPSIAIRPVNAPARGTGRLNRVLLMGAILFYIAAGASYLLLHVLKVGQSAPGTPAPQVVIVANGAPTLAPATVVPATNPPTAIVVQAPGVPDTDVIGSLMQQPPDSAPLDNLLYRQQTAFTIAPARPRPAPIDYPIRVGDTIEGIAKRYNITQDSIIWNNDVGYVNRLAVGTTLRIPPIDGILYKPTADETIEQIANKFKVSPYAIIDSEYNRLTAARPETMIPANELEIMIPGGVTKKVAIYWKPTVSTRAGGGVRGTGTVRFGGGPGSCGYVSNGGGDGSLGRPLNAYTVQRGFSSYHSGIDLAIGTGTPVFAAGAGTVIFAGWSEWGYGNAIVIAHTPGLWTLYGHLSRINVSCGQFVERGAGIGAVGSTGNSTGPHLHFETRVNGEPVDPRSILGGF